MYCLTDSIIINLSSDCTATTYRSYFFVQKAPNIYDNAESVIGGYICRTVARCVEPIQSSLPYITVICASWVLTIPHKRIAEE